MSDLWLYTPEICDGDYCPMDCDHCYKSDLAMEAQAEEEKDDEDGLCEPDTEADSEG